MDDATLNDVTLAALLTQDAPLARDLAFELAVMARIEQRQFRRALLTNITLAVGAALLLALVAPLLENFWRANLAPTLGASNLLIAVLLLSAVILAPQLMLQSD